MNKDGLQTGVIFALKQLGRSTTRSVVSFVRKKTGREYALNTIHTVLMRLSRNELAVRENTPREKTLEGRGYIFYLSEKGEEVCEQKRVEMQALLRILK